MLKTFSRFSIEKSNVYFSDEKFERLTFEPLTVDSLLGIHERFWDLNFKLCFPNDNIQIEAEQISIDFSIKKISQFQL